MPRCRRSCSSSSRAGPRRCARSGACCGRAARFAYVTWLVDERAFAPDRDLRCAARRVRLRRGGGRGRRIGDIPSVDRAAAELRRAGFRDVAASRALLDHAFTVDGYIAFLTEFDEETLFDEMDRAERRRFLARLRERLMALDPDELHFRAGDRLRVGRALGLSRR